MKVKRVVGLERRGYFLMTVHYAYKNMSQIDQVTDYTTLIDETSTLQTKEQMV